MSMLDQLEEMGFPHDIAEKALRETGETGLIEAVEWIAAHQKDSDIDPPKPAQPQPPEEGSSIVEFAEEEDSSKPSSTEAPQAMSFKCDVCGKHLVDDQAVMFHAARTKHEAFSESTEAVKPLTEEEKKERLAALQNKLKEARAKKEEEERKETLEKEKRRRLEGKSIAKAEEERKEVEMKKMLEEKKREKREEMEARKRVLEQIRLDREARKLAEQLRQPQPTAVTVDSQLLAVNEASPVKAGDYCQIQVRLLDGSVIKEKFKSDEPLSHVRLWVEMHGKDTMNGIPFTLMTPFPRKIFTDEDMEAPIKALGLLPSANMVVTRAAH
ncbi:UBX domain-containing protein [Loa loa]|uniref:UBX domain-containing protein n=1 Tax=Loa loa TaxID=7209 RepID=A0A1I7VZT0_LOALO|nr:UBX domain-containing protein [Loa loa]EFO28268.1 UBX domain-containing protein [Loa loa]